MVCAYSSCSLLDPSMIAVKSAFFWFVDSSSGCYDVSLSETMGTRSDPHWPTVDSQMYPIVWRATCLTFDGWCLCVMLSTSVVIISSPSPRGMSIAAMVATNWLMMLATCLGFVANRGRTYTYNLVSQKKKKGPYQWSLPILHWSLSHALFVDLRECLYMTETLPESSSMQGQQTSSHCLAAADWQWCGTSWQHSSTAVSISVCVLKRIGQDTCIVFGLLLLQQLHCLFSFVVVCNHLN